MAVATEEMTRLMMEAIAAAKDSGPTNSGAWQVHDKAMAADKGQWHGETALVGGTKAAVGASNNPYYTGPNSLFGVVGLQSDIISTRIQPRGISGSIPAVPTNYMNPLFGYLTGFLAESGSNPDTPCDDPVTAGPAKSCIQTAAFGRYSAQTRVVDVTRVGQRINDGDAAFDLRIINDPLLQMGGASSDLFVPNVPGGPPLAAEILQRMREVGITFQNKLMRQLWQGNPANNGTNGGYSEFPGLDILIGTNKLDAITGATCVSLNSLLADWNYGNISTNATNGTALVNQLTYMCRYVRFKAERENLDPTTFVIAMRETLFYEVINLWPCSYLTSRCISVGVPGNTNANTSLYVDAVTQRKMIDDMRQGRYLLIDGEQWPVVFDDGIVEKDGNSSGGNFGAGIFSSDIYIIPITVQGGLPVTFLQYFDYSGSFAAMSQLSSAGVGPGWYYTDGGRFLWAFKPPNNFCIQWVSVVEPRIIFRCPQLAARLQNVAYQPLIHTPEPFPDDPYFQNGGVSTNRRLPGLYSDWNLTGV